ncbi:hypothetical protein CKO50_17055 [Pseudoalteromonas sp. HM-SA03]|uniref:hypothetical protein n=1 Tax=Pseudoalteromonas sp. HM-SA03 TaxID=2029678 RepID=UPI000BAE501B|nr:hypothetical protein [Pseudoalteromonas sp. HM-SA03]PAY00133.1 hypothetical protein CKO50_17055 [Pseudoalteromonas sp. HM-SA03]
MAFQMYKWDDVGAPALSASKGSLANLLLKCLVNGYDGKPSAGWQLHEHSDNFSNLIISPASNKWYYLIYDDGRNTYLRDSAALLGAIDAWTDIETPVSSHSYADWHIRIPEKSYSNQSIDKRSNKWVLLANTETAYLLQADLNNSYSMVSVIGKLNCATFDDLYICLAANPNWLDHDELQFLSNRGSGVTPLVVKTKIPIKTNPNTMTNDVLTSVWPSSIQLNLGRQVLWNVWTNIGLYSGNEVIGTFPDLEFAVHSSREQSSVFQIEGGYLYFNNSRWPIL